MTTNFDYAWCLEQKSELTEHLVETVTPYIFEGLTSMYREAHRIALDTKRENATLLIFQKMLQEIDRWNQIRIEEETKRIKQMSNTSEYFDDLVKAVIKSNITLLTNTRNVSNVIAKTFYDSFQSTTFIHRCYTECGKDAHNNPYLYYHDVEPMDFKRNQIMIIKNIREGIPRAIRKVMPISLILKEYLVNSLNIIPDVELVGYNGFNGAVNPMNGFNLMNQTNPINPMNQFSQLNQPNPMNPLNQPNLTKPLNLNKLPNIDPDLQKQVMDIIKEEHIKSDRQKVAAIMNMDKLITSLAAPVDMPPKKSDSAPKDNSIIITSINVKGNVQHTAPDDFNGAKLNSTEKKLLNLNFDDMPTNEGVGGSISVSATSLNSSAKKTYNDRVESSERIDPSKVKLIEDYGSQKGGERKMSNRKQR